MPANKRRSRHGSNNLTTASSAPSILSLSSPHAPSSATTAPTNALLDKANRQGFARKGTPQTVNGGALITGIGPSIAGTAALSNLFTLKQQQQLDRNAYLLTLTKDQLKVECRKRGQKSTGTKIELVFMPFLLLLCVLDMLFWRDCGVRTHTFCTV